MMPHPTQIVIRPMSEADLDRVLAIAASLPQAPHWTRAAYLAALDPQASLCRIALAAEVPETGTLAGFAVASLQPPQAELETIAIDRHFQRRGIARELMAAVTKGLKSAHVTEVTLEVRESNHAAVQLYGSFGFVKVASRPRYYADPVEDAVLLQLRID